MAPEEPDSIRPLLDVAAERGVISGAQRDALIALHAERLTSTSFSADAAVSAQPAERRAAGAITQLDAPRTSLPRRTSSWGVELPSGLNSVTVAYTIGAMLVVFAAAWFLADRWKSLGPWGVLLVVLLYAGVLVGSSVWLERRDYRQASAALLTLAVALTPVAVWSLEVITGFWPVGARSSWMDDSNQWMAVCWIVVDLTTLLAALLALRWRPSVSLTIPVTVMMWGLWLHLSRAVVGEQLVGALDRWLFLVNGLLLCAVAGEADRWQIRVRLSGQRTEGDFAFFLWLGGLIAFAQIGRAHV